MIDYQNITKTPSIPSTDGIQDPVAKSAISALKKIAETSQALIPQANKLDKAVTYRDLFKIGLIDEQWIKENLEN